MSKKSRSQSYGDGNSPYSGWNAAEAEAEILPPATAQTVVPPRHVDWKARLIAYLAEVPGRPKAFGLFDCALFTLDGVAVMTGLDLAAPYRGRYATLRDGIALLRRDGFRDHVALVSAYFGEIAPAFAQVGDVAVITSADGPALGLVNGEYIYALTPERMVLVPFLSAMRAFRVG